MSPMLAGVVVALMLIACVCYEVCTVPAGHDLQDTAGNTAGGTVGGGAGNTVARTAAGTAPGTAVDTAGNAAGGG